MGGKEGYGQYCPISIAAEIVAERWTPLVIRAFFCGATRFNEIQDSVPRMSSALLTRRLRELEQAGIVRRQPEGRGHRYLLTPAGRELWPMLEQMGCWAQRWLRREITSPHNLDPDLLMWELRRSVLDGGFETAQRRVVDFTLTDMPPKRRRYWLVFDAGDVDICLQDPGHAVDLWVSASMHTLVEVWLGHRPLDAALRDGSLCLDGARAEIAAFRAWFKLSRFAPAGAAAVEEALA